MPTNNQEAGRSRGTVPTGYPATVVSNDPRDAELHTIKEIIRNSKIFQFASFEWALCHATREDLIGLLNCAERANNAKSNDEAKQIVHEANDLLIKKVEACDKLKDMKKIKDTQSLHQCIPGMDLVNVVLQAGPIRFGAKCPNCQHTISQVPPQYEFGNNIQEAYDKLRADLSKRDQRIADMEAKSKEGEAMLEKLWNDLSMLTKTVENLQRHVSDSREKIGALQKDVLQARALENGVRSQLSDLQGAYGALSQAKERVESEKNEFSKESKRLRYCLTIFIRHWLRLIFL